MPSKNTYCPIVGTLGYVLSKDQTSCLLVHRNARKDDDHLGKYNGLGGKMHADEDIVSCMKREILEEAGIECLALELRGSINWTGFGPSAENWLGFIFRINQYQGTPYSENDEGKLEWVKIKDIPSLPLWEGDHFFLDMVFDQNPLPFHGYMPYKNDKALSWSFQR